MPVRVAVEGDHDAELARRVLQFVGLRHEEPIVAGGKGNLDKLLRGYNNAARFAPWLILRDLDEDASCAASLRDLKLPSPAEHMRFRVVVHAAEAWLLADEERICSFLKVDPGQVPGRPEDVRKPKIKLAELGGKSKSDDIKADMAPSTGRKVGRGYDARVMEFTRNHWRPEVAAVRSDSLARCIKRLKEWT